MRRYLRYLRVPVVLSILVPLLSLKSFAGAFNTENTPRSSLVLVHNTNDVKSSQLLSLLASNDDDISSMSKPRILCLHGKAQTAESFSKKIGGARRKLERAFDLTFLDGPINLDEIEQQTYTSSGEAAPIMNTGRAWFLRELIEDNGSNNSNTSTDNSGDPYRYIKLTDAIEYVANYANDNGPYDALMGFSQGGTLATALATSGAVPVRAVLTAGAPHIEEAFVAASAFARRGGTNSTDDVDTDIGLTIPKLHLAGETDAMISTDSTSRLAERGGNGEMIVHEKGHLFPTRAVHVDRMVEFLKSSFER